MAEIIDFLVSNKPLLVIAVFISVLIVLSALKKLVKFVIVLLAVAVLYVGYLVYTGQKVPKTRPEIIKHGAEKIPKKPFL